MREILVTVEIGRNAVETSVIEVDDDGRRTLRHRTHAGRPGLIQSLAAAEQDAKVDIRRISIQSDVQLDMVRIRAALRGVSVEVV